MKKTLFTMLAAGAVMCAPVFASAQEGELPPPPPPHEDGFRPEMRKAHHDKFAQELGLTDEQKAQAEKIRQAGREKMKPLMDKMKAMHKEMDKLRQENMQEFEKILTPEQQTKLKEMKAKMDEKMKNRRPRFKHGRPEPKD